MARSKINVLSNELDQAPKTRSAGYDEVVDSMREDMAKALDGVNIPNILSNESDEAPKTRAAGYEQNVLEPLKKEIDKAMDRIFLDGSDVIADYMNDNTNMNDNTVPLKRLLELRPGDHLSFEIKREKHEPRWITQTVWHLTFLENLSNIRNFIPLEGHWKLQPGEKSLIIVVEKDYKDPKLWKLHAEQLEYPGNRSLLMEWAFFHNPNVSDERFKEIIWTAENKEESGEGIKNDEEKTGVEAEEKKESDNPMKNKSDNKKSWRDTIKWWFK